jgi:hypothetical protein
MARISLLIAAALMLALTACTAVTDFKMPPGGLYDLEANIPATIAVTLAGDGTGSLALNLTEPLPDTGNDEDLLALLADGTIMLTVLNDATSVSFDLTAGERVMTNPGSPGQYALSVDATRAVLSIQFYNETTTGATLQSGDTCTATIDVLDNAYFVATVDTPITRSVTVN